MLSGMESSPFEPAGVTWSAVSWKLATSRRLVAAIFAGGISVGCAAWAIAGGETWAWLPAGLAVVVLVWAFWVIGRQVRAIGYAEREEELLVRSGIMWRTIVVVPYGRLQYVDVQAGPLDRLFGISQVQLHTASASTDAVIPGLPPDEAARLRDRLTARGQSRLAGL